MVVNNCPYMTESKIISFLNLRILSRKSFCKSLNCSTPLMRVFILSRSILGAIRLTASIQSWFFVDLIN